MFWYPDVHMKNSLRIETYSGASETCYTNIMKTRFNTLDAFATTVLGCISEWRDHQSKGETSYISTI